jgi:hypothetical protein
LNMCHTTKMLVLRCRTHDFSSKKKCLYGESDTKFERIERETKQLRATGRFVDRKVNVEKRSQGIKAI